MIATGVARNSMSAAVLLAFAVLLAVLMPTLAAQTTAREPRFIRASSTAPETNTQLSALVAEVRKEADAFVFLSGGASKMQEDHQRQLLAMFDALSLVTKAGHRLAVGDGGTKAGIMEAAGLARKASGHAFPLI
ncbi:MAG: hypothetical protein ABW318_21625, partial [Vicinamibacterales bacterium]